LSNARPGRRIAGTLVLGGLLAAGPVLTGCESGPTSVPQSHTLTVRVQDTSQVPVPAVDVTVWVVDVDLRAAERAPILLGSAPTDARGEVRFSYTSVDPPYVCGWEVREPGASTALAQHPPAVPDNLSPGGIAIATVP